MIENANPRILIVEDEPLLAMHLQRVLEDLGFDSIECAQDIEGGRELLSPPPDLALLDVNLRGRELVYPLAHDLRRLGAEILFCTSVLPEDLPEEWRSCPCTPKAPTQEVLARIIARCGVSFPLH